MTVSVTRVGIEPILLVTASGYLSAADMGHMFEQSLALIGADEGIFYRITDMDSMTLSFTDLPAMLTLMTSGARGSTSDPQIRTVLVGTTFHAPMLRSIKPRRRDATELSPSARGPSKPRGNAPAGLSATLPGQAYAHDLPVLS